MPQLLGLFVCDEHKVIGKQLGALFHVVLFCLLGRHRVERYDERLFDPKDCIRCLVVGAADVQCPVGMPSATSLRVVSWDVGTEYLRYQVIEPVLVKHEMHMARPPAMPPQLGQQLPHRPVVWNWIWHGYNGMEPEQAVLVAVYDGSTVCLVPPVVVLHVVLAVAVCFPDVYLDALNGLAGGGLDGAEHEERIAVGIRGDGEAVVVGGGVVGVEGAEDGAFCRVGGFGMVDRVDEEGETDYVGEQDELLHGVSVCGGWAWGGGPLYLPHVCTYLPDLGQELDACHPLVEAQPCLARKVVEVRDETLHDVLQPWVGALRVDADDVLGDVVDCQVLQDRHRSVSRVGRRHVTPLLAPVGVALAAAAGVLPTSVA